MADQTPNRSATAQQTDPQSLALLRRTLRRLRLPLALTRIGLFAERGARAFWPLWTLLIAVLAVLMLGLQDLASVETVWATGVLSLMAALWFLVRGFMKFRWVSREDAFQRLDASLVGRPLTTLRDAQALGAGDAASARIWAVHQGRMADRAADAKAVEPDLRVARFDPFGMRYVALTALFVALLFGSVWRVSSVVGMTPGGSALAAGPSWEGWVEPPAYTGLPVIYLNDIDAGDLAVAEGSRLTLRFYGQVGALSVDETVSGRVGEKPDPTNPAQDFTIARTGELTIDGPGGRAWDLIVIHDTTPTIALSGKAETNFEGRMTLPFSATDDYGITGGEAVITLDLDRIDRRYGLALPPEARDPIVLPLPIPIAGSRSQFEENLIDDFSKHPWANMPVRIDLSALDAAEQTGRAEALEITLAARRFFDPLAATVIELRRDLLWNRANARRVVQLMKAVSWKPDGLFRKETAYLRYRTIMRRLNTVSSHNALTTAKRDEIAEAMWDLALLIEEGDIGDAMERMRAAQEKLTEAMKNGASDQEIARLMQELRDATKDYMRQLSQQAQRDQQERNSESAENQQQQDRLRMTQDDLQRMMDRIQQLMEEGKMAEAQQALDELQRMMENMRVTQGEGGQGQSPGDQAMDGLSETLRDQQGLSDQAFRDLQEQFNPGANAGQSQGNEGRNGGQGRGQSHEGQGSDGQNQSGQGQQGQANGGGNDERSLAQRQEQLRRELERQRGGLPDIGGEAGRAAREALNRAEGAMRDAEDALKGDDLAAAIDKQAEAMDALREGMRNLGEALAEQQREMRGGQGDMQGNVGGERNDPLGRNAGSNGQLGNDQNMLQGEDVYRRARELLDEIRRRSGEGARPEIELDYLRRLMERF
ncbi:TIGR02302 family protein [Pseudooceanicola sp.]|uniref:TIGR02302 family protein n=1 Tax=Pseudooceanicola sp. TaxID=1914328 RepID=UPI0026340E11|nr:TIGR02302 family protein [Pseudooceanicola sp.]MDF1855316.1 TIGR02302 family protein [Pseudooceanicola sp.]